jgi:hypothetical protein
MTIVLALVVYRCIFGVLCLCCDNCMIAEFTKGWPQGYTFAQYVVKCFMVNISIKHLWAL